MSSRAIQRLRRERGESSTFNDLELDDIVEDEDDDDHIERNQTAFFDMMNDSDDSESEEDDDEESKEEVNKNTQAGVDDDQQGKPFQKQNEPEVVDEEDLDALLAEFEEEDEAIAIEDDAKPSAPWFHVIVSNLDARDLDIDYVLRTSLLGGMTGEAPSSTNRRSRQSCLFGTPRDGWVRPPHFVGGGMGMTTYEICPEASRPTLPWPYNQTDASNDDSQWNNPKYWFTFVQSDSYKKDLQDYERIKNSGDVNALALFVAHHPFVVEALLQLTMVLYHTNQSQDGLALLRRSLWIFECSSLSSFKVLQTSCFMDHDQPENAPYFNALFRMMQVSGMAGCIRTSLAISRYLLALDPRRDPMGVLLSMDYFSLSSMNDRHDKFLISLVESKKITMYYQDGSSKEEYRGELLDLPNWAYAFSLALYRRAQAGEDGAEEKADIALQSAIRKFPSVVEELLVMNEVDVTGRSMRSDWPTVLRDLKMYANNPITSEDYDPITHHAVSQAIALIIKVFVKRSHKLWSGDDVLMWLYKNCTNLFSEGNVANLDRPPLSPAVIRYARCDPADYEDRFQTLPDEANPLDPGLLAPAMAVNPNRRRFIRRPDIPAAHHHQEDAELGGRRGLLIGGPPTNIIDPDDPILEVFWRSLLPWNTVDGLPRPNR